MVLFILFFSFYFCPTIDNKKCLTMKNYTLSNTKDKRNKNLNYKKKKKKYSRSLSKVSIHRAPVPPDGTSQSTEMSSVINKNYKLWHKNLCYLSFVGLLKCKSRKQRARGVGSAALVLDSADIVQSCPKYHRNSM